MRYPLCIRIYVSIPTMPIPIAKTNFYLRIEPLIYTDVLWLYPSGKPLRHAQFVFSFHVLFLSIGMGWLHPLNGCVLYATIALDHPILINAESRNVLEEHCASAAVVIAAPHPPLAGYFRNRNLYIVEYTSETISSAMFCSVESSPSSPRYSAISSRTYIM